MENFFKHLRKVSYENYVVRNNLLRTFAIPKNRYRDYPGSSDWCGHEEICTNCACDSVCTTSRGEEMFKSGLINAL